METAAQSPDRTKLLARLKALLAMTTDKGCTEEEAMVAAAKASELMAAYDLSYADTEEVKADSYGTRKRPHSGGNVRRRTMHEASRAYPAIGRFCDCRCWVAGPDLIYFGTAHDTETAHYLADVVRLSMDYEWGRYLQSEERDQFIHGRTLRTSFMMGMVRRVVQRLDEMRAAREAKTREQTAGTSRALVLVTKQQMVSDKFATYSRQHGLRLGKSSTRRFVRSADAYEAGKAAGNRVALNPSIGSGGGSKRLT